MKKKWKIGGNNLGRENKHWQIQVKNNNNTFLLTNKWKVFIIINKLINKDGDDFFYKTFSKNFTF